MDLIYTLYNDVRTVFRLKDVAMLIYAHFPPFHYQRNNGLVITSQSLVETRK